MQEKSERECVCVRARMLTNMLYVFCWMGGLCVIHAGLREFLKGCGVPEKGTPGRMEERGAHCYLDTVED